MVILNVHFLDHIFVIHETGLAWRGGVESSRRVEYAYNRNREIGSG